MLYLALKSLHVVSVVLFLGNIITGVFWKVHADLHRRSARACAGDPRRLIRSDRCSPCPACCSSSRPASRWR